LPSVCAGDGSIAQTEEVNNILLCESGVSFGLRTFGFYCFVEQDALQSAGAKFIFPQKSRGSGSGSCRSRCKSSNVTVGGYVH